MKRLLNLGLNVIVLELQLNSILHTLLDTQSRRPDGQQININVRSGSQLGGFPQPERKDGKAVALCH